MPARILYGAANGAVIAAHGTMGLTAALTKRSEDSGIAETAVEC